MPIASVVFDPSDGSIAESKADQALLDASTADSKALSTAVEASIADSKAVVAADEASVADSKALSTAVIADGASNAVFSAVGSEPAVGDYRVTDIKRDTAGLIVMNYDDSQIT